MDDFEAFRQKKLAEKKKAKTESQKEFKVAEEGKASGLISHSQKLRKLDESEIPKIKGFDSHIKRADLDPESIEKFGGKKLWGDDIPKVDPDSVDKVNVVSHINKADKIETESLDKPKGLNRY